MKRSAKLLLILAFACLATANEPTIALLVAGSASADEFSLVMEYLSAQIAKRKALTKQSESILQTQGCPSDSVLQALANEKGSDQVLSLCVGREGNGYFCLAHFYSAIQKRVVASSGRRITASVVQLVGKLPTLVAELDSAMLGIDQSFRPKLPQADIPAPDTFTTGSVDEKNISGGLKTPKEICDAGLLLENKKLYAKAIDIYSVVLKRFPKSEYAAKALFSMGLCYEEMGRYAEMADVFTEYDQMFANDYFKQVQALVKAGNAFFNIRKYSEAKKDYLKAISVYDKFRKRNNIDVGDIAEAYFKIGDIYYSAFTLVRLDAKSEKAIKDLVAEKTKTLEEAAKNYAKAINLGVAEWTIRATYMIGKGFVDMAEAVENQTIFGTQEMQLGSKIKILSSLGKYYQKAQEYFYKNIEWARNQNITSEYIDTSIDKFMEVMFRKGDIMEEVGRILKNAPIPKGLPPEDEAAYREVLEEKWLEAQEAALPHYEEAVKVAKDLGIAQNRWLEKAKDRVREIRPNSDVLKL
jgi:tetratricopeptide (TPR) repeat protein